MAIVWLTGGETGGVEWGVNSGTPAVDATTKKTGAYSIRTNGSNVSFYDRCTYAKTSLYTTQWLGIIGFPASDNVIIQGVNSTNGVFTIQQQSDGKIKIRNGSSAGTLLGTSTTVLNYGTWWRIETKVVCSGAGAGIIEVKIYDVNDTLQETLTYTGLTTQTQITGITRGPRTVTQDIYWDDVVETDSGYPGSCKVIARQPKTGTPTYNNWTPSGADPYWADTPYNDTTYMTSVAGTNVRQTKLMAAFNAVQSGHGTEVIESYDTVIGARVLGMAQKTTTKTTNTYALSYRYNAANVDGANITLTRGTDALFPVEAQELTDAMINAPTLANLNAMEVGGIHKSGTDTNLIRIEDMWVQVAYTPLPFSNTSRTVTAKANILVIYHRTITVTAKADIKGVVTKTVTAKGKVGNKVYSMEANVTLPTNDTNLSTIYSDTQIANVATDNNENYVDITGSGFLVHLFKFKHTNKTDAITVHWNGKTTLAPGTSIVKLQIYNQNATEWQDLDSDNATGADTDFDLEGSVNTNLSNYYDSGGWVMARVYQEVV